MRHQAEEAALTALEAAGFVDFLLEHHITTLKGMRLQASMGEAAIVLTNPPDEATDLQRCAQHVIEQASCWPYQDEVFGIPVGHMLKEAAAVVLEGRYYTGPQSHCVAYGMACNQDNALMALDDEFLTPEIIKAGLTNAWEQLKHLDAKYHTPEIVAHAVKVNFNAFHFIKNAVAFTPEVIDAGISACGACLKNVPVHLIDKDMANRAVERTPWAICYVPDDLIDKQMVENAVRADWKVIDEIPDRLMSRELIEIALQSDPDAIGLIEPQMLKTFKIGARKKRQKEEPSPSL